MITRLLVCAVVCAVVAFMAARRGDSWWLIFWLLLALAYFALAVVGGFLR